MVWVITPTSDQPSENWGDIPSQVQAVNMPLAGWEVHFVSHSPLLGVESLPLARRTEPWKSYSRQARVQEPSKPPAARQSRQEMLVRDLLA